MYKQFRTILIVFLFNLLFLSQSYSQIIIDTDGSKENVNQVLPYKVEEGDSLTVLANRFLIPVKELQQINNIDGTVIKTGQTILIPIISYTVREGDSLLGLAAKYRIPVKDLQYINKIEGNTLKTGQTIYIPKRENKIVLTSFTNKVFAQEIPDTEFLIDGELVESEIKQPREIEVNQEEQVKHDNTKAKTFVEEDKDEAAETNGGPTFEIVVPQPTGTGPDTRQQDDIVNLQSEMELKDLIQTMSEISSEAFILDDSVKGKKVIIIAPQGGFKRKNAMRLFETILDLNGFSIVSKQGVNKIVQKKDIKTQSIPTDFSTKMGISSDRYITKIISLKNVKAEELSKTLKSLVSKEGDLVVYSASNKLIIIDTVDNINRIVEIISNLDVEKQIEFIKIENADAADVATKLLEIFGAESRIRSTQSRTSSRRQVRATQGTAAQQTSVTGESDILGFKVITDERTNSLIVIAYPQDMEKIRKVVSILDILADQVEQGIYVLRIKNADAEQIVGVLSSIIGSGSGGGGRQQIQRTRLSSGGLGSAQTGIGSGESRSAISRQARSASISSVVAETDGLRITADPATNSVIIIGSRRDYEAIKTVIDELDIRRKQVFVEAAILEVGLNDLTSIGVNFSFGATLNGDNLLFGGQQLPGVQSLLGIAADPDAAITVLGSLQGLFLGVVGEEIDIDGSGPIPPIPSFTALFQALTSITDVNVLSTPSILTTDNEEAEIVVADIIPFPTGSTIGTSGVTVQTIERLPVGIRLAITPQISEGEYMNLNIITEVSNTTVAPADLNTQDFGIATQTRSADSSVIVRDGQTIVIGGLVSDRESIIEQKTPLLGDIPWIGNLFKFKSKQSTKLNLMILLTPRIVETDADMQEILEEQQRRKTLLHERGLDVLEERKY